MYSAPSGPRATPQGKFNCASVAGPLSPEKPLVPVPAKLPMLAALAFTHRNTNWVKQRILILASHRNQAPKPAPRSFFSVSPYSWHAFPLIDYWFSAFEATFEVGHTLLAFNDKKMNSL